MLSKNQIIAVSSAVLLTFVLYFGFGEVPKAEPPAATKTKEDKTYETVLLASKEEATAKLTPEQKNTLHTLESVLSSTKNDSTKVESLKQLASFWYQSGKPEVSGYYADMVSDILKDKEAYQITGTTYRIALSEGGLDEKVRDVCSRRAIRAFENAIRLDSTNVNYQMQLAMVYVDKPLEDNPMKGILMLRELNTKHPENADVNIQLGRLAIKTGQFEKAVERLKKAVELSPGTVSIYCLLADAYTGLGDKTNAGLAEKKCKK